jgi:hypothetical protein
MFKIFRKNCCGLDIHKTWIEKNRAQNCLTVSNLKLDDVPFSRRSKPQEVSQLSEYGERRRGYDKDSTIPRIESQALSTQAGGSVLT